MRSCHIGDGGINSLVNLLFSSSHSLTEIDLSNNYLTIEGVRQLELAQLERKKLGLSNIRIDIEGNVIIAEILNSTTHALGIILCLIGSQLLMDKARDQETTIHYISCLIYSISLMVLYISSTLYHSFFLMKRTKQVLKIFDHCAIYILIAGTYTPFLSICFPHKPYISIGLLSFLWCCAILGMLVEGFYQGKKKVVLALILYLFMGWCAVFRLSDILYGIPRSAAMWLIAGGLAYTIGVPFFALKRHLFHAIWHVFVLVGSACHYISIYGYIVDLPLAAAETVK